MCASRNVATRTVVCFPVRPQEMQRRPRWRRVPMSTQRLIGRPGPLVHGLNYQYLRRYLWLPGPSCLSSQLPRVRSPLANAHISHLAAYSIWWGGLRNPTGSKVSWKTVAALNRTVHDNNRGDSELAPSSINARYRYESVFRKFPFKVPKAKNPEV